MKSLLQTLYFQKKRIIRIFIQFYFACFYDTNFSDTMVEYMESYTDPKNPKIEASLTSYFEDRVKSLLDDIIKREYARRLLHDINLFVQDDIVKQ